MSKIVVDEVQICLDARTRALLVIHTLTTLPSLIIITKKLDKGGIMHKWLHYEKLNTRALS